MPLITFFNSTLKINLYPYLYRLVTVDFVYKALILSQCENNKNLTIIYFQNYHIKTVLFDDYFVINIRIVHILLGNLA